VKRAVASLGRAVAFCILQCESHSQERRISQMMGFGRMAEEAPLTLNFRTSRQKNYFPKK
jgi:hypothetical protein